jgi:DNA mismatch repair protein MutS
VRFNHIHIHVSKEFSAMILRFKQSGTLSAAILCSLLASSAAAAPQQKQERVDNNIYKILADYYLPSMAQTAKAEKKSEKEVNEENREAYKKFKERQGFAVAKLKIPDIGNAEKIKLMYSLLAMTPPADRQITEEIMGENVYRDMEVFSGNNADLTRHLFGSIDRTITTAGKIQLQKLLATPTSDITQLQTRQAFIAALVQDEKLFTDLQNQLNAIRVIENQILLFWKTLETDLEQFIQQAYFNFGFLQKYNTSTIALETTALTTFLSPVFLAALPAVIFTGAMNAEVYEQYHSFLSAKANTSLFLGCTAILMLIQAIPAAIGANNVYAPGINLNNITKTLQGKMINTASYTNGIENIKNLLKSNAQTAKLFPKMKDLETQNLASDEAKALAKMLSKSTFKGSPSFFSFHGRILASFKLMQQLKHHFVKAIAAAGEVDACLAVAQLYKEHEKNSNARYCFVDFVAETRPRLEAQNFWHPILDSKKVVPASIALGGSSASRNAIVTGPNAGGKSTTLKALTLAVWFAQSFGVAPASAMTMTPFAKINTYLNITDSEGRESLFQAEMRRAQQLLDTIKNLENKGFSFVIMDEIFTGTNPREGQAGAYGVAKHLAGYTNSIAMIATHFKKLTELETVTNGAIKNFKVSVIKNPNGSITYPYKLEEGITDQAIALDLLQAQGFNAQIMEDAYAILNETPESF